MTKRRLLVSSVLLSGLLYGATALAGGWATIIDYSFTAGSTTDVVVLHPNGTATQALATANGTSCLSVVSWQQVSAGRTDVRVHNQCSDTIAGTVAVYGDLE